MFRRRESGRRGLRATALACCAATFLATPASAGAGAPGAPGAGDPYFPEYGNGGYDVSHYDVRLRYQPGDDHLQGTTTIVARPTQDLSAFNLDFALHVKSVRVNGAPAAVRHEGTELTVTPQQALPKDSLATFVVDYDGVPSQTQPHGKSPWVKTADGALAVGEPEIAPWWFPSNDHPKDKATYDVSVAVPDGTQVLSNGVNTSRSELAGWTTWNWRTTSPTATYLAFLAIGGYEINSRPGAGGQPFISAYSNRLPNRSAAQASVERTPEVLDFLSGFFGPYPFEAQGGVVPDAGIKFALENQTRPVYSPKFFEKGSNPSVIVHENAHEWFGDSVSVRSWRDIWLNEGFATYAEWLWSDAKGQGSTQQLFDHYYSAKPADDPFWQVPPGEPGRDGVFGEAVYDRGALTVQALRNVVGDQALLDITRSWVRDKRHSNGNIEEFIHLAEQKSGKNLQGFFKAWLFTPGKPAATPENGVPAPSTRSAETPASVGQLDETHRLLDED